MSIQRPDAAQIRGALGLLRWENEDLARACKVTPQSISNIKRGVTRPQPRILAAIKRVLEFNNIEFLDNSGVRFKPTAIETFEGRDGFVQYYEMMHEHILTHGGDIVVSGVDERLFEKYQGDYGYQHLDYMAEVVKQRKDFRMRILVVEGDYYFTAHKYATYRWQPKEWFSPTAFYVFGDCLGLISFSHDPAPHVVLIKSAAYADAYRHSFNVMWKASREPDMRKKK